MLARWVDALGLPQWRGLTVSFHERPHDRARRFARPVALTDVTGTLVQRGPGITADLRDKASCRRAESYLGFCAALLAGAAGGSVATSGRAASSAMARRHLQPR